MMKFLVLVAMLGYGGYKLHRKSERWLDLLGPLLGAPERRDAAPLRSADVEGDARPAKPGAAGGRRSGGSVAHRKWLVLGPLYALALVGSVTVGHAVTRAVAGRGYDAGADAAAATVAREAHQLTYAMLDHPVQRLFIPGWRVVDVRLEPGRCTEPLGEPALRDYVADVRLYTFFALPYRTVAVTCGGAVW